MNKTELMEAISKEQEFAEKVSPPVTSMEPAKKEAALKHIPSAKPKSDKPLPQMRTPVENKVVSITSSAPEPKPVPVEEPVHVWEGEEGPELPSGYGVTVLRAMPRDPHWVYVYWEIAESTRSQIIAEEGEWFFDTADPFLRVFDEEGKLVLEIPVLLDAQSWYVNIQHPRALEFELGLKTADGKFKTIAKSNRVSLPPMQPSDINDEDWAMVGEEFEQILQRSAGVDTLGSGSSGGLAPHVLRHRVRIPWEWKSEQWPSSHVWPSSQAWPSSHILPSSHTAAKK